MDLYKCVSVFARNHIAVHTMITVVWYNWIENRCGQKCYSSFAESEAVTGDISLCVCFFHRRPCDVVLRKIMIPIHHNYWRKLLHLHRSAAEISSNATILVLMKSTQEELPVTCCQKRCYLHPRVNDNAHAAKHAPAPVQSYL